MKFNILFAFLVFLLYSANSYSLDVEYGRYNCKEPNCKLDIRNSTVTNMLKKMKGQVVNDGLYIRCTDGNFSFYSLNIQKSNKNKEASYSAAGKLFLSTNNLEEAIKESCSISDRLECKHPYYYKDCFGDDF